MNFKQPETGNGRVAWISNNHKSPIAIILIKNCFPFVKCFQFLVLNSMASVFIKYLHDALDSSVFDKLHFSYTRKKRRKIEYASRRKCWWRQIVLKIEEDEKFLQSIIVGVSSPAGLKNFLWRIFCVVFVVTENKLQCNLQQFLFYFLFIIA